MLKCQKADAAPKLATWNANAGQGHSTDAPLSLNCSVLQPGQLDEYNDVIFNIIYILIIS